MIYHVREGLRWGFPLCCVLRFAVERALNPAGEPARKRGVCDAGPDNPYVPCNLFHHKEK